MLKKQKRTQYRQNIETDTIDKKPGSKSIKKVINNPYASTEARLVLDEAEKNSPTLLDISLKTIVSKNCEPYSSISPEELKERLKTAAWKEVEYLQGHSNGFVEFITCGIFADSAVEISMIIKPTQQMKYGPVIIPVQDVLFEVSPGEEKKLIFERRYYSKADLRNGYFSRSQIIQTNFENTEFSKTDFSEAKIENSGFDWSIFEEAVLRKVCIVKSHFNGTNFINAILNEADIRESMFSQIIAPGAKFIAVRFNSVFFNKANLPNADFTRSSGSVVFTGSNMKKANFSEVKYPQADMLDVDIKEAVFEGAELEGVNFKNADGQNAKFRRAVLRKAKFKAIGTFPEKASFNGADFTESDLTEALIDSVDMKNACFYGAEVCGVKTKGYPDMDYAVFDSVRGGHLVFYGGSAEWASFKNAELNESKFMGLSLKFADFIDANLSNTVFCSCALEYARFDGANLSGTVIYLCSGVGIILDRYPDREDLFCAVLRRYHEDGNLDIENVIEVNKRKHLLKNMPEASAMFEDAVSCIKKELDEGGLVYCDGRVAIIMPDDIKEWTGEEDKKLCIFKAEENKRNRIFDSDREMIKIRIRKSWGKGILLNGNWYGLSEAKDMVKNCVEDIAGEKLKDEEKSALSGVIDKMDRLVES